MPLNSSVRENGEIIVTSGSRLTIENAAEFSRILCEALDASKNVTVEFEPDVEIDITGVQVICSACKKAAQDGSMFLYNGTQPQALVDIIASSGAERNTICKYNNNSNCLWFRGTR